MRVAQHHAFMVILTAYIEDAFRGWRQSAMAAVENRDALLLHIMLAAARISARPLDEGILAATLDRVPYNADYFRRAFRLRIGHTPQKFAEVKKMERAVHFLALGRSVKETANDLGDRDPLLLFADFQAVYRHQSLGLPAEAARAASAARRDLCRVTGRAVTRPAKGDGGPMTVSPRRPRAIKPGCPWRCASRPRSTAGPA